MANAENVRTTNPTATSPSSPQEARKADELRETARQTGADLQTKAREAGQQLGERAQELTTQTKEMASEYYQQGRDQALEWERAMEAQIREKPIQSLLIAGGIGLLIGLLWRR